MNMNVGGIHFKSQCKHIRHINYTLIKILCEFIDNVIKKCSDINISTVVSKNNYIHKITISDNYEKGFENILESREKNPFNMGHIRDGHDNDNETSEFGIGMKAGAIACANKFTVYTKVNNKYYRISMDFTEMELEPDIDKSYNPTSFYEINESEYKTEHIFSNGSTIILESVRREIYKNTDNQMLTKYIQENLSKIYTHFIKNGVVIKINSNKVEPCYSFFEDNNVKIFNITAKIFIMVKNDFEHIYFASIVNPLDGKDGKNILVEYNNDNIEVKQKFLNQTDLDQHINNILIPSHTKNKYKVFEPLSLTDKSCIEIISTFTYFSKKILVKETDDEEGDDELNKINQNNIENIQYEKMPENKLEIYKDNRKYCDKQIASRNNGHKNYTLSKMNFKSKNIGKMLGISFNKDISLLGENDLISFIKKIVLNYNNKYFTADKGTSLFKRLYDYAISKNIEIPVNKKPIEKDPKPPKAQPKPVLEPPKQPIVEPKPVPETPKQPIVEPKSKPDPKPTISQPKIDSESESDSDTDSEPEPEPNVKPKPNVKPEPKIEPNPELVYEFEIEKNGNKKKLDFKYKNKKELIKGITNILEDYNIIGIKLKK